MHTVQLKKLAAFILRNNRKVFYIISLTISLLLGINYGVMAQHFNTLYGINAGVNIDHGDHNAAFGYQALAYTTRGSANAATGSQTLFIGSQADNYTGRQSVANGSQVLYFNTMGSYNTGNGAYALYRNTTASLNTANGHSSLNANTTGQYNIATGFSALVSNVTGNNNTALGLYADVSAANLENATAIGYNAKVTTSNTIQLGNNAVTKVYAGVGNTATLITGGLQVTGGTPAIGKVLTADANGIATWQNYGAVLADWSLTGNTGMVDGTNFIGTTDNIPLDIRVNNQKAGRIDHLLYNTFYGYQSGNATTGSENVANGYQALYANTTGNNNAANGCKAFYTNVNGSYNTATGYMALYSNTISFNNTANGSGALVNNTTGGYENDAIGFRALYNNTSGRNNTAIGKKALYKNKTGGNNTAIGSDADVSASNLDNATAIGSKALVNASNKVVIGNGLVTVIGGYANWSTLSDARFKKNIQQDVHGLDFIMQLKPVTYNLDIQKLNSFLGVEERNKNAKQIQAIVAKESICYNGFLAQEVEQAAAAVQYNFSGVIKPAHAKDHYSMSYSDFVVPLVKGMQEQQKMLEAKDAEIKAIKENLQQQINELKKLVIGNGSVTKDPATKQIETAGSENITLYPNPTTGICTITASNINNGVIEIYDMEGNSLQKTAFNNAKAGYPLNVSGYAKGVYLLNIIANNKKYTKRLVIQ